mmetsp:Transcript_25041/g.63686  ORF Transcript_25041/g.63686 Transcript_25041/m.63686 type:complete len:189 (-) Transcript_25041:486-1052(-)
MLRDGLLQVGMAFPFLRVHSGIVGGVAVCGGSSGGDQIDARSTGPNYQSQRARVANLPVRLCGFFEDEKLIKAATDAAQEIKEASARKPPKTKNAPPVQHSMSANAGAGTASAAAASAGASAAGPDEEAPLEPMKSAPSLIGRACEDEETGMSQTMPGMPIGPSMEDTDAALRRAGASEPTPRSMGGR